MDNIILNFYNTGNKTQKQKFQIKFIYTQVVYGIQQVKSYTVNAITFRTFTKNKQFELFSRNQQLERREKKKHHCAHCT